MPGGDSKIEQAEDAQVHPELYTGLGSGHHHHSASRQLWALYDLWDAPEINIYFTIIMYIELSWNRQAYSVPNRSTLQITTVQS